MTPAPVGLRCPDHARGTNPRRIAPPKIGRSPNRVLAPRATIALIVLNVIVYLITAAQGSGFNDPQGGPGTLYFKWVLFGPFVVHGGWYRLVTAMFLHGFFLHIALNMVALWVIGRLVEGYLGPLRFLLLYFVAGLAGSAGALVATPAQPVVGASGAIFGVLGAMMLLEWQMTGRLAGQAMSLIVINLLFNFAFNGLGGSISIGGHIGGLIGGILVTLGYGHWGGTGRAQYGRVGIGGVLGLLVVAAGSVGIAYLRVRGYS
jgi:membrane associated rhomboid family serine protease